MPVNRTQWTHPDLQSLVQLFFADPTELGKFAEIQAEELPQPSRRLLAHTSHMTVTMEKHHQSKVDVHVLDRISTDRHYSRKIALKRQSDGKVVQFGIVRLAKNALADEVFKEIASEQQPLGRILIDHQVLRTVKLMTTWKINPGPALKASFDNPGLEVCYGRTALIYMDGILPSGCCSPA